MSDEGKLRQDFNEAIKTAQDALSRAMNAFFEIGQRIGQLVESIRKHQKELEQDLAGSFTGVPDERRSRLEPLARGLDARVASLAQKNRELQRSLGQLRGLQGKLPKDTVQQLDSQLDHLQGSIQTTLQQNRRLGTALAQSALVHGRVPPLAPEHQARAMSALDQRLAANTALSRPTPQQARQLKEANIKTALLGHRLTKASEGKALEAQQRLDQTLVKLADRVNLLRTPAPPAPSSGSEAGQEERRQIKKKR